jgi:hypothetical protein
MIKAKLSNGALLLGIEERNIAHFRAGHPLFLHGAEIGGFADVTQLIIVYGTTLKDVYEQLNDATGGQLPPFLEPEKEPRN